MNYQKIYEALMQKRRANPLPRVRYSGVQRHHIIPRALGGTDEKSNLIILTEREHWIAHLLLAKIHGGSMMRAAWMYTKDGKRATGRLVEWIRTEYLKEEKKRWTPERRAAWSDMIKERWAKMPPEKRKEITTKIKAGNKARDPKTVREDYAKRSKILKNKWSQKTIDDKKELGSRLTELQKQRHSLRTPEQKIATAKKIQETKKRNKALRQETS